MQHPVVLRRFVLGLKVLRLRGSHQQLLLLSMSDDDEEEEEERPLGTTSFLGNAFWAGGLSGATTRCLCQPLDVLKIRFQLQLEPISRKQQQQRYLASSSAAPPALQSKYSGLLQALRTIRLEEGGLKAFWKGHVPAQCLSVVYSGAQFLAFEALGGSFGDERQGALRSLVCGGVAGGVASCAAQPLDVIRTRLVAQGEPKIYRGMGHAALVMFRTEGPWAFYKGLLPTVLQVAPNAGLQFAFYAIFRKVALFLIPHKEDQEEVRGFLSDAVAGCLSGMSAKTAIYPLDVVKKRLQVQGFHEARKPFGKVGFYSGMSHCFLLVVKEEGFLGLFKGFGPSLLKAGLTTGLTFAFYGIYLAMLQRLRTT